MAEFAPPIRLLVLDVDGVLTDGGIQLDDHGVETKRFHVRDGSGIKLWMWMGLEVALLSGRSSLAVRHRARELDIGHVIQGSRDKTRDLQQLLGELEVQPDEVAMIGDDLPDLAVLELVGYPIAVADAAREVRDVAEYVTTRPGGHGAVREAIEHLLRDMDLWDEALAMFGNR